MGYSELIIKDLSVLNCTNLKNNKPLIVLNCNNITFSPNFNMNVFKSSQVKLEAFNHHMSLNQTIDLSSLSVDELFSLLTRAIENYKTYYPNFDKSIVISNNFLLDDSMEASLKLLNDEVFIEAIRLLKDNDFNSFYKLFIKLYYASFNSGRPDIVFSFLFFKNIYNISVSREAELVSGSLISSVGTLVPFNLSQGRFIIDNGVELVDILGNKYSYLFNSSNEIFSLEIKYDALKHFKEEMSSFKASLNFKNFLEIRDEVLGDFSEFPCLVSSNQDLQSTFLLDHKLFSFYFFKKSIKNVSFFNFYKYASKLPDPKRTNEFIAHILKLIFIDSNLRIRINNGFNKVRFYRDQHLNSYQSANPNLISVGIDLLREIHLPNLGPKRFYEDYNPHNLEQVKKINTIEKNKVILFLKKNKKRSTQRVSSTRGYKYFSGGENVRLLENLTKLTFNKLEFISKSYQKPTKIKLGNKKYQAFKLINTPQGLKRIKKPVNSYKDTTTKVVIIGFSTLKNKIIELRANSKAYIYNINSVLPELLNFKNKILKDEKDKQERELLERQSRMFKKISVFNYINAILRENKIKINILHHVRKTKIKTLVKLVNTYSRLQEETNFISRLHSLYTFNSLPHWNACIYIQLLKKIFIKNRFLLLKLLSRTLFTFRFNIEQTQIPMALTIQASGLIKKLGRSNTVQYKLKQPQNTNLNAPVDLEDLTTYSRYGITNLKVAIEH